MQLDLPEGAQLEINHELFNKKRFRKPYLFRRQRNRPDPTKLSEAVEKYGMEIQELRFQKEIKTALNDYLKDSRESSTDTIVEIKNAAKAAAEDILVATFKNRNQRTSSRVKIFPVAKIPRTIQMVTHNVLKVRTLSEVSAKDKSKKWIDKYITLKSESSTLDRTNTRKSKVRTNRNEKVKSSKTHNTFTDKDQTLNNCKASLSSDKYNLPSASGHKDDKPDQIACSTDSANVCKASLSSDKHNLPSTSGHKDDKPDQIEGPADSPNACAASLSSEKHDLPSTSGHKHDKPDQIDCPAGSDNFKASNVISHSIYSNVPLKGLNPKDPRVSVRLKHENANKASKTKSTNLDKPESNIYSKIPLWGLHPNDPRVEKRFEVLDLMRMTSKEALKKCCAVKHDINVNVEEIEDRDCELATNISKHKHEKTQNSHFRLDDHSRSPITKYNQVYLHVHKHIFAVSDDSEDNVADNLKINYQSKHNGYAVSGNNNNSKISSNASSHSDNKSESSTANIITTDINSNLERFATQEEDIVFNSEDEINCSSSGIIDQEVQHKKPLIYDKSIGKRVRCGRGKNSKRWQALRRRLIKKQSD